jgi:hypothetical protein
MSGSSTPWVTSLFGLLLCLAPSACSSDADGGSPTGNGGGGTESGGNGGDGDGGTNAGGGGAANTGGDSGLDECTELEVARAQALAAARECVPNGDSVECGDDTFIANDCGCPVAVNSSRPNLVTAAEEARDAWSDACDPPMRCQLIDCASSGEASSCEGASGETLCQW